MKNKRGLSIVISTFIIILIALSSAFVLLIFINKSRDKFESGFQSDCFNIRLKPLKCETYGVCSYNTGISGYEAEVLVRRDAGGGDLNAMRFLFKKDGAILGEIVDAVDVSTNGLLSELEIKNFREEPFRVIIPGDPFKSKSVSILALIGRSNVSCQIESSSASCNEINTAPNLGFTPALTSNSAYLNNCCQYPLKLNECATFNELQSDCLAHGCTTSGNAESFSCNGVSGNVCSFYTSFGEDVCEYHGCEWSQNVCEGIPDSCSEFSGPRNKRFYCCGSVPGGLSTPTGPYNPLQYPHCFAPYPPSLSCGNWNSREECSVVNGCYWNQGADTCTAISCTQI